MTKCLAVQQTGARQQGNSVEHEASEKTRPKRLPATHPLDLTFYRQSVRRFIFSNNIPLSGIDPSQVIDIDLMHPLIRSGQTSAGSARYVGGVNPYAVYEADIRSIDFNSEHGHHRRCEVILEFTHPSTSTSIQVVAVHPAKSESIRLRLVKEARESYESVLYDGVSIKPPYRLQVQLTGKTLNVFYTKDEETRYLGRVHPSDSFAAHLDLRHRATALASHFCIRTHLPKECTVTLGSVHSYLSAGIGQADIRLVTHEDGAPFFSPSTLADANRLWFTFTIRGLGTGDGAQGVCSLDPSTGVADLRFEGLIVLDHGDGLLRNSYACHLFYHDEDKIWRAWFSDFGGASGREGRGETGLLAAESVKDPRRGFCVMKARELSNGISGHHEDPCGVWDAEAGRWRLLTTELSAGMQAKMWESKHWDGPWTAVGERAHRNCTGTLIQRVGQERFVFSGSSEGRIFVFRYPDLKELGTLEVDLPPFTKSKNSRVWPNVVPLPSGYPARYIALMMDRANFPEVSGPTWSYGAMYLYWAHTPDISGEEYEFSIRTDSGFGNARKRSPTKCLKALITDRFPELAAFVGPGSFSALGLNHGAMSQPDPQDSARTYCFLNTPENFASSSRANMSPMAAYDALCGNTGLLDRWGDKIKDLLSTACSDEVQANTDSKVDIEALHTLLVGHSWQHKPGVTVIGDAANLMCPWAGEGVNLAMWDALDLSRALAVIFETWDVDQSSQRNASPFIERFVLWDYLSDGTSDWTIVEGIAYISVVCRVE